MPLSNTSSRQCVNNLYAIYNVSAYTDARIEYSVAIPSDCQLASAQVVTCGASVPFVW